ncbi:hypothetical protein [Bacillus niameyensis]|uniref:hypothetical protein n=1 Tax=Bacillus niameyensis TaxID=1522308 RepID=UPI000784F874|nr:hypothetical protein [Bacillus niameyensis]
MFLKKKWFVMLAVMTAVLLLGACGGKDSTGEIPPQNGPQDRSPDDLILISEGFEKYPLWIGTSDDPGRDTYVHSVSVFENGKVTEYGVSDLYIKDIIDLSDDEIIQLAKANSNNIREGNYTLDITLDRLGQTTEEMKVVLTSGTRVETYELESAAEEYYFGNALGELKDDYPEFDLYVEAIKNGDEPIPWLDSDTHAEINGDQIIETRLIEDYQLITFKPQLIQQTIFDTTFSGLRTGDSDSLLTRVDNSFVGFKIDGPDSKGKNVTIEEYE